jgi:hypothetical protein
VTSLKKFITDNKTNIIWTLTIILVLLILFAFGVQRYGWGWTGFLSYTTPKSDTEEFHPGKTLWDLMELLIIPAVLAGVSSCGCHPCNWFPTPLASKSFD